MKKLLVIFSILVSVNTIGANANAGILIEPYVGYHIGGTEQGTTENDVTGLGYGARLGWTLPLVFIALDYSTAGVELEPTTGATSDADYTATGLVVGASLPVIRVWAGYNFSAELDVEGGSDYEGTGMKAGLGFKMPLLPISFNLEYIINEFDEANGASLAQDLEAKTLFLSISAPLNL